jgi:hypothetical protein
MDVRGSHESLGVLERKEVVVRREEEKIEKVLKKEVRSMS